MALKMNSSHIIQRGCDYQYEEDEHNSIFFHPAIKIHVKGHGYEWGSYVSRKHFLLLGHAGIDITKMELILQANCLLARSYYIILVP